MEYYLFMSSIPWLWRRQWYPTPVLLPGKSHGRRSLVGCRPWGHEESDTTEWLHFHFSLSCIGEGHGSPLQCSCLENPRDGGAWWATIYGDAQSRTRLKWLSSSSIPWLIQKSGCIYFSSFSVVIDTISWDYRMSLSYDDKSWTMSLKIHMLKSYPLVSEYDCFEIRLLKMWLNSNETLGWIRIQSDCVLKKRKFVNTNTRDVQHTGKDLVRTQ